MTIVDSTTVDVPTRTATSRKPGEKRYGVGRIVAIAILIVLAAAWLLTRPPQPAIAAGD